MKKGENELMDLVVAQTKKSNSGISKIRLPGSMSQI